MAVVFIHITLPFRVKGSSKIKSDPRVADGPRSIRKQKDQIFWDPKQLTPLLYSRRVALERCCISSMCPTCLHLLTSTLSPVVEALTDRGGLLLPPLPLHPSCYSGALCSNKCLLCHTSPPQRNGFILPLSYTPPQPSLPAHSPTFTHTNTHSHTRGARIQMGCLP